MTKQKEKIQLELVKRVAQHNWTVEDLKAVDDLLTDLYTKGEEQKEKDKKEFEDWKKKKAEEERMPF
tara:strand:+ start:599 stop:799 length:201 start_codon:yes stop_codon:yes gene_type:complete